MTDQKTPATSSQPQAKPVSSAPPAPPKTAASAQPNASVAPPKPPAPPPLPKPAFSVSGQAPKPGALPPKPPAPSAPPKTVATPPAAPKPPAPPSGAPRPPQPASTAQPPRPTSSVAPVPPAVPRTTVAASSGGGEGKPPASSILQAPKTTIPQAPTSTLAPRTAAPGTALAQPLPGGAVLPKVSGATPKTPADGQIPPAPKPAEFKKSPLRFLPIIIGVLLLVGLGWFVYSRFFGARTPSRTVTPGTGNTPNQQQVVLTYWGLWEPTPVLEQTLAEFESLNPDVKVNYQQQTYRDYRERLQTAIAAGRGPDVFRFHASWVPMLRTELDRMPSSVYSSADYQNIFFPIANQQLQYNNEYVGVPLMYDGLALFYNKEVLQTANAQPPKTWAELKELSKRLTIRSEGRIERAGLAIGNASNVDNFADILGLLMLQNGASPTSPTTPQAIEALTFYTDFYTQDRVWDESLPNSTVAFARGEVAMIIAPSWRAHDIIALNPNLTFDTAPVPQLGSEKITWASYWAEGVSAQSKNKALAWELLKYMSSQNALQRLYSDASRERTFGEIYPRTDMSNLLADSPYVAAFLADAPFAQDSYTNTFTHDNGLNDQVIKYYEDAVTSITQGKATPENSVGTIDLGVRQILRQYNLTP